MEAMRQRWDVTDELKRQAIQAVRSILSDPSAPSQQKITAVKVLLAMEKQNQEDEFASRTSDSELTCAEANALVESLGVAHFLDADES